MRARVKEWEKKPAIISFNMQSQTVEMHKANAHSLPTPPLPPTPPTQRANPDFCAIYDFGLNKLIARNVFRFKCPSKWQSGFWQQFSFLHRPASVQWIWVSVSVFHAKFCTQLATEGNEQIVFNVRKFINGLSNFLKEYCHFQEWHFLTLNLVKLDFLVLLRWFAIQVWGTDSHSLSIVNADAWVYGCLGECEGMCSRECLLHIWLSLLAICMAFNAIWPRPRLSMAFADCCHWCNGSHIICRFPTASTRLPLATCHLPLPTRDSQLASATQFYYLLFICISQLAVLNHSDVMHQLISSSADYECVFHFVFVCPRDNQIAH